MASVCNVTSGLDVVLGESERDEEVKEDEDLKDAEEAVAESAGARGKDAANDVTEAGKAPLPLLTVYCC